MKILSSSDKNKQGVGKKTKLKNSLILFFCFAAAISLIFLTYRITVKTFPQGINQFIWEEMIERGHNCYQKTRIRKVVMQIPQRIIADVNMPRLYIDVKFKHMQKIYAKRQQALKQGVLIKGEDDFIPAEIRLSDDHIVKIKMRLKGDWTDHLKGDKWSFRIHTKGKDHLFGMRRFSIQNPVTRGYQGEVLFHKTILHFGGLAPKYFFVNVAINGKDIGVMAVEEHFSKELLERNGRKEGVIIRFDESALWEAKDGKIRGFLGTFDNYMNANIDSFQSSKINKSKRLQEEYGVAVGLLRGFVDGTLKPSDVFDYKQVGNFLAISEYFGSWHAVTWHNLRFYLNPLTMKLEPISFDANLQDRLPAGISIDKEPIVQRMLEDKKISKAFKHMLSVLDKETQNGKLLTWLKQIEVDHIEGLRKEFYMLEPFDYKELKNRIAKVGKPPLIDPEIYPFYVNSTRIEKEGNYYLELSNALPYDVEIQSIVWVNKAGDRIPLKSKSIDFPIIISKTELKTLPQKKRINYEPLIKDNKNFNLEVQVNIKDNKNIKNHIARLGFAAIASKPLPTETISEILVKHPFLKAKKNENIIKINAGNWQVKGNIVIPKGYEIHILPGTQLAFEKEANFIIYGRTKFIGTTENPIILKAQGDETNTWRGIAVHEAEQRSYWSNVKIFNTTGVAWSLWKLTGGVTFYKSDVDLDKCLFNGSKGEDALNIVNSDFNLRDIIIRNTASDAFDGDFTTGTIAGGEFQNIGTVGGGDGVDISGSVIKIDGVNFNQIYDKAISVGEGSKMNATNIFIENSSIGAASKDGSKLEINNSTIKRCENFALMAYMKKPEFGPASIVAIDVNILETIKKVQVQQGSYIELNREVVKPEKINIKELYNTIMKPGMKK